MTSLEAPADSARTGSSPVFVDGSGRRSLHVRGITATLFLVIFAFLVFAIGVVATATDAPVRWTPKSDAQTVPVGQ